MYIYIYVCVCVNMCEGGGGGGVVGNAWGTEENIRGQCIENDILYCIQ